MIRALAGSLMLTMSNPEGTRPLIDIHVGAGQLLLDLDVGSRKRISGEHDVRYDSEIGTGLISGPPGETALMPKGAGTSASAPNPITRDLIPALLAWREKSLNGDQTTVSSRVAFRMSGMCPLG